MFTLNRITKDTVIYGVGGGLAKGMGLFLLPIYTRIFTPAEYGTIEMLTLIGNMLSVFLVLGMDSALSMYFSKEKQRGVIAQAEVVSAVLSWRIIWGTLVVAIATLLSPLINAVVFDGELKLMYFFIAFVGALFLQVMRLSTDIFRLTYKPLSFISITLFQSVLSAVCILILVLWFEQGVLGYFLGTALASIIVAFIGIYKIKGLITNFSQSFQYWTKLLKFGIPLVFSSLMVVIMSTLDRWFIQHYLGPESVGIYAVGAKFVLIIGLMITTIKQAWWPYVMDALHDSGGEVVIRRLFHLYTSLVCIGVITLTLISPMLIKIFTTPEYHEAWKVIGVLSWQTIFYGFFFFMVLGLWKKEKTYLNPIILLSCLISGVILNYILVPSHGLSGAAIATSLSYLIWITITYFVSNYLWPINLINLEICMQVFMSIITIFWLTYGAGEENILFGLALCFSTVGYCLYSLYITIRK